MFTGIVEELGTLKSIIRRQGIAIFEVKAQKVLEDAKVGDSVAVNGVCLTVIEKGRDYLGFEVIAETLKSTTLGQARISEKVNLERALKVGERLSGHFVTGHVDTIGLVRKRRQLAGNLCLEIAVSGEFMKYILPKGSIAVDGISLTIAGKQSNLFVVNIIPHTFANTTLGGKTPSAKVNIEFDILAKKAIAG